MGTAQACLVVFKDELRRMLPHDDAARLARNACHFGEFFTRFGVKPPRMLGSALLWSHCHHRATGGTAPGATAAGRDGPVRYGDKGRMLRTGGIVGIRAGQVRDVHGLREQALLSAVRDALDEALVVAGLTVIAAATRTASRAAARR